MQKHTQQMLIILKHSWKPPKQSIYFDIWKHIWYKLVYMNFFWYVCIYHSLPLIHNQIHSIHNLSEGLQAYIIVIQTSFAEVEVCIFCSCWCRMHVFHTATCAPSELCRNWLLHAALTHNNWRLCPATVNLLGLRNGIRNQWCLVNRHAVVFEKELQTCWYTISSPAPW